MEILIDKKKQELIRSYVPNDDNLKALALFFDAFSDKTRLKILSALAITEMCVSDLSILLNINQTTLSHQLGRLKASKVVDYRKQGKVSFYYIRAKGVSDLLLTAVNETL